MDILQVVGFFVGLASLFYMYVKKVRDERLKRESPREWEQKEAKRETNFKKLLRSMDLDIFEEEEGDGEEEVQPSPKKVPVIQRAPQKAPQPKATPTNPIAAPRVTQQPLHMKKLLLGKENLRTGMILKEILSLPRSLKSYDFPEK